MAPPGEPATLSDTPRFIDLHETLTRRERQVFGLAVAGNRNRQIGAELGISEKTVKVHRGSLMRKMNAGSIVDLVKMADALLDEPEIPPRSAANGGA